MQPLNNTNTSNNINVPGNITTLTKFIFIAIICILVNIPLYFMDEKWIAGLFTSAWAGAAILLFLYNYAFNLNVTSYSLSNFFNSYLAPILVYAFWIISIYWLVTGNADLAENPSDSTTSRNIAAIFTAIIPFLAIVVSIVTYNYKSNATDLVPRAIGGSIFAFLFGLLCYYINTLRISCYGSKKGCWAFAGWSTLLAFILITAFFVALSFIQNMSSTFLRMFQIFPKNFLQNISAPINIFSIVMYLILWISSIIVFFRHKDTFGDEESDPINIIFTIIALFSLLTLFLKQFEFASGAITRMIQYFISSDFHPWSILLHFAIIFLFIFSINITTSSLDKTGWANSPSILAIFISILVLIIFYIGILYYRN
jgi:hypothetical protein